MDRIYYMNISYNVYVFFLHISSIRLSSSYNYIRTYPVTQETQLVLVVQHLQVVQYFLHYQGSHSIQKAQLVPAVLEAHSPLESHSVQEIQYHQKLQEVPAAQQTPQGRAVQPHR